MIRSCKGITDRTIRILIRNGACSMHEIGHACDAGRGCGGCHATIDRLVVTEGRRRETPRDMMKGYER